MYQDSWENIEILLRHGADLNNANEFGERTVAISAAANGRLDWVVKFLELGYSRDLVRLSRSVEGVAGLSREQEQWRQRALEMLKERGVSFPLPPVKPLPCRPFHPELRATLEEEERQGKYKVGSGGWEMLQRDRACDEERKQKGQISGSNPGSG